MIFEANVVLLMSNREQCPRCSKRPVDIGIQLPITGDKPVQKNLCKPCVADIVLREMIR